MQKRRKSSTISRLSVWIPITVSIGSLVSGVFQYYEKRRLDFVNRRLDSDKRLLEERILELEFKKAELELKERNVKLKEIRKKQANIAVHYLEIDLRSIEALDVRHPSFYDTVQHLLKIFEEDLPFDVRLRVYENIVYKQVREDKDYIRGRGHHVTFLLIRNTGQYEATDISVSFRYRKGGIVTETAEIYRLDPAQGVVFFIDHFDVKTGERFGTVLHPSYLKYLDGMLGEWKEGRIRSKNEGSTFVGRQIPMVLLKPSR